MSDLDNGSEDSFEKVNTHAFDLDETTVDETKKTTIVEEKNDVSTGLGTLPEDQSQIQTSQRIHPPPPPLPLNRSVRHLDDSPSFIENKNIEMQQQNTENEEIVTITETKKMPSKIALKIREVYNRPQTKKILNLTTAITCWVYTAIGILYAISDFFSPYNNVAAAIAGLSYQLVVCGFACFLGIFHFKYIKSLNEVVSKELHFMIHPVGIGVTLILLSVLFQPTFFVNNTFWGVMSLLKTITSLIVLCLGIIVTIFGAC